MSSLWPLLAFSCTQQPSEIPGQAQAARLATLPPAGWTQAARGTSGNTGQGPGQAPAARMATLPPAGWTQVARGTSGNTGEVYLVLNDSWLTVVQGNVAHETVDLSRGSTRHRGFVHRKVFMLASNKQNTTRRLIFKFVTETDCEALCCRLLRLLPIKRGRPRQSAAAVDQTEGAQDHELSSRQGKHPTPPPTLPLQHADDARLEEFIRLSVLDRGFLETFVATGECYLALDRLQLNDKAQSTRHASIV